MVRTRAAISPTGYPHIGTIYQAWFDYAFAKKNKGQFIVRIEDTDKDRTVADAEEKVFAALDWFNLTEDESSRKGGPHAPYRQSERLEIYKKYALELVDKEKAYYCFCSRERLDEVRQKRQKEGKVPMYDKHCRNLSKEEARERIKKEPWVIRLKVPENTQIVMKDELRKEIVFQSNDVDEQVLLKSDGYPTYFLAVVVDDHLMGVTHMVRGEEWLTSSAKIILLYDFLNWEKPLFFHTPIIRNPDKSKFSKRQGHTNVSWYQEQGFLPEVILNYLALMGWSHPEGKEIFSREEFIKLFDLKDINVAAPIFDLKKLEWMNGVYIRESRIQNLEFRIEKFIGDKYSKEIIRKTIPLIRERIKKLSDYLPMCEFFFKQPEKYEIDLSGKIDLFVQISKDLEKIKDWTVENIGNQLVQTAKNSGLKNSEFFMLLRVAITGKKISPPLNESMEILGKEVCLRRIKGLTG